MNPQIPSHAPQTIELVGPGRYRLSFCDREVLIDALRGARICAFSLKGSNCLTGPEVDPNNFGSTFWTSPQSDWHWPPVEEIDSASYAVDSAAMGSGTLEPSPTKPTPAQQRNGAAEVALSCTSSPSAKLGLSVTKRFSVLASRSALAVDYTLHNRSDRVTSVAPWEISRVPGGLSFFEAGAELYSVPGVNPLQVVERDGIVWFDYRRDQIKTDQKMFSHSHGNWLAHVAGGQLLIKEFEPVPPQHQAPGEALVELFASGERDYVEIEQQGSYRQLAPGAAYTWRVVWLLAALPIELEVSVGNSQLVNFVREVLSAGQPSVAG